MLWVILLVFLFLVVLLYLFHKISIPVDTPNKIHHKVAFPVMWANKVDEFYFSGL